MRAGVGERFPSLLSFSLNRFVFGCNFNIFLFKVGLMLFDANYGAIGMVIGGCIQTTTPLHCIWTIEHDFISSWLLVSLHSTLYQLHSFDNFRVHFRRLFSLSIFKEMERSNYVIKVNVTLIVYIVTWSIAHFHFDLLNESLRRKIVHEKRQKPQLQRPKRVQFENDACIEIIIFCDSS